MERTGADAPPHNCPQPATKNRKTVFKFYLLKGQPLYDFFENGNAGGWPEIVPPSSVTGLTVQTDQAKW